MQMQMQEEKKKKKKQKMRITSKYLWVGLAIVMILGTSVYFRLWIIDYNISSSDSYILRRQFDLAHREAVDESAEWRLRFDQEREISAKCVKELAEVKELGDKNTNDTPNVEEKLQRLQKENKLLLERLESLQKELQTVKLKCTSQ